MSTHEFKLVLLSVLSLLASTLSDPPMAEAADRFLRLDRVRAVTTARIAGVERVVAATNDELVTFIDEGDERHVVSPLVRLELTRLIAARDLNGDENDDLVAFNASNGQYTFATIYVSNPDASGSFTAREELRSDALRSPELVLGNFSISEPDFPDLVLLSGSRAEVWAGGKEGFARRATIDIASSIGRAAVLDDPDGELDRIVYSSRDNIELLSLDSTNDGNSPLDITLIPKPDCLEASSPDVSIDKADAREELAAEGDLAGGGQGGVIFRIKRILVPGGNAGSTARRHVMLARINDTDDKPDLVILGDSVSIAIANGNGFAQPKPVIDDRTGSPLFVRWLSDVCVVPSENGREEIIYLDSRDTLRVVGLGDNGKFVSREVAALDSGGTITHLEKSQQLALIHTEGYLNLKDLPLRSSDEIAIQQCSKLKSLQLSALPHNGQLSMILRSGGKLRLLGTDKDGRALGAAREVYSGRSILGVTVDDATGDGHPDIVVSRTDSRGDDGVTVLSTGTDGKLSPIREWNSPRLSSSPPIVWPSNPKSESPVVVKDAGNQLRILHPDGRQETLEQLRISRFGTGHALGNDAHPELVALQGDRDVLMYRGSSTEGIGDPLRYRIPERTYNSSVFFYPVTDDELIDILVVGEAAIGGPQRVWTYEGLGEGRFESHASEGVLLSRRIHRASAKLRDITRDGRLEFIAKVDPHTVRNDSQSPFGVLEMTWDSSTDSLAETFVDVVLPRFRDWEVASLDDRGGKPTVIRLGEDRILLDGDSWPDDSAPLPRFLRGDSNGDGQVDIADPIACLLYLFDASTTEVPCVAALDADVDGDIRLSDAIAHLNFLFLNGPRPRTPNRTCGASSRPTDLLLGCEQPSC